MLKSICSALALGSAMIALPAQAAEQIVFAEDQVLHAAGFDYTAIAAETYAYEFEFETTPEGMSNRVGANASTALHQELGISGSTSPFFEENKIVPNATLPEPATWLMMLFGFAAIGAFMRSNGAGARATKRVRYNF